LPYNEADQTVSHSFLIKSVTGMVNIVFLLHIRLISYSNFLHSSMACCY